MVAIRKPSFRAKRGTFKKRVGRFKKDVDFFGPRWSEAMDGFLREVDMRQIDARLMFEGMVAKFYDRVILRTPIDTGAAQSGWNLSEVSTKDNYEATIYNTVPYIIYLEYGWSKQAPRGMVRITLDEMTTELRIATARLAA